MCGIAGIFAGAPRALDTTLLAMAGELEHRGPDGVGLYLEGGFGMVNTRLAVVDLAGGDQPLSQESGRYWVMQNGEIYNHVELRAELESLGHTFSTSSDTEVIAHAYEQWGRSCLERLNGDFALAVWDRDRGELFLARDRFGVRPLFLAEAGGDICFASEIKALLQHPDAVRALDPTGIVDTFTLWSPLPDASAFVGIRELPPAHYAIVDRSGVHVARWWDVTFEPRPAPADELVEELRAILDDSLRLRLRADVEVATYLSGGLDSSLITAMSRARLGHARLTAFGLGFADADFDESAAQDEVAARLDLSFRRTVATPESIAASLPRALELAERPLLRTAPAPLLLLSESVRTAGLKVVLTGEGADELFAGYDLFREDRVRRFWARDPKSTLRPLLLRRLNRWLAVDPARSGAMLDRFYARGLADVDDPLYSHRLRFDNTARTLRVLAPDLVAAAEGPTPADRLEAMLPAGFGELTPLARAQYLELTTFFSGYLMHAQGDRMLMGNSVEGRFPYLDHRVAELAARLPDHLRLKGLEEKHLLRRAAAGLVPDSVRRRPKVPYRAPIRSVFRGHAAGDDLLALLGGAEVARTGLLSATSVDRLVAKVRGDGLMSETDEMALIGAVSLQLLHDAFTVPRAQRRVEPTRVVDRRTPVAGAA